MLTIKRIGALAAMGVLLLNHVMAQPSGVTAVVVPFPAGGALDVVARILTHKIGEQSGEAFVIDNKVGANGLIGAKAAAKAKPDGRTVLVADGAGVTINPFLYPADPTFSAERDLRPLRTIATQPMALVVKPNFPANNVNEFIALAIKELITYSSAGVGTSGHLTMSYLNSATGGLKLSHIPYRGGPQAMQAVLAGEVNALFDILPNVLPLIKRGDLKVLAVSSAERSQHLPNVPTMVELGYPGFTVENRFFVWVPSATPDTAAKKVDGLVLAALKDPSVIEKIRAMGLTPLNGVAESDSTKWLISNRDLWKKVIQDHNIRPE